MLDKENEHLEFKEAKRNFHFETLVKYCAALANEGGGKLVLGVTDRLPRRVVGSRAFENLERTKAGLVEQLHIRIDAEEIDHPQGRVLVFYMPARPIGTAIQYKGAYWMRAGEDLVPMTPDQLKRIFDEGVVDFSALTCPDATLSDLDPAAIAEFGSLWRRKSGNASLETVSLKLLESQLLNYHKHQKNVRDDYAFLNAERALGRFLAQAEVVFEYRSSATSVEHQTRTEFREGFFLFKDDLWEEVNRRNDVQHIQEGMFIRDIPTFSEQVVREAILNAVSHRDYRLPGSVFTRQFPRDLQLLSPGGFPPGISEANILYRQAPRNRRVAEALTKCGLVERSGQGVDKMFRESILEGKSRPAYTGTDEYQVTLTVHGDIQNPKFVRFIEELSQEQSEAFSIQDLQALDLAYRSQAIPAELGDLSRLVDRGVLERVGRGRGTRYILSRRFYKYLDEKGTYTRKRGLDRETNKELLLRHIKDNSNEGSRFSDLKEVLPMLTRPQVQTLLRELKEEDKIHVEGATRGARWYPDNSRRIESQN